MFAAESDGAAWYAPVVTISDADGESLVQAYINETGGIKVETGRGAGDDYRDGFETEEEAVNALAEMATMAKSNI